MRRRFWLLLLTAIILAGCAGSPAPQPDDPAPHPDTPPAKSDTPPPAETYPFRPADLSQVNRVLIQHTTTGRQVEWTGSQAQRLAGALAASPATPVGGAYSLCANSLELKLFAGDKYIAFVKADPTDCPIVISGENAIRTPDAETRALLASLAEPLARPDPAEMLRQWPQPFARDQVRAALEELMNEPGSAPPDKLRALFERPDSPPAPAGDARPWAEADLDGDGSPEWLLARAVEDPGTADAHGQGAALFVIYRQDGRYMVDRTDRLPERVEVRLMAPVLHAVTDVAGLGRPQIVWSRPVGVTTGLHPLAVFVTTWRPGQFTHLPGEMMISSTGKEEAKVTLAQGEIVLTGRSRSQMFLRTRTDRYRYVDGQFRLVDRQFAEPSEIGYDRFWAGLVAEDVGRVADAERGYRAAAEPGREAHGGEVYAYNTPVRQLTDAQRETFGQALRTFARFRLGALLLQQGRSQEAAQALGAADSPYPGLLAAMRGAASREAGCTAATAWATANPAFLAALNAGVSHEAWQPAQLCGHVTIEDSLD